MYIKDYIDRYSQYKDKVKILLQYLNKILSHNAGVNDKKINEKEKKIELYIILILILL